MLIGARGTPTNKSAERHAVPAHFILFFVILMTSTFQATQYSFFAMTTTLFVVDPRVKQPTLI